MNSDILNKLYEPFDEIQTKPGSGKYKYVKSRDIIDRINKVFGGNWSSEVVTSEVIEDNVLVCVRVYVKDNGHMFYHDGYGSSQIARFSYGDNQGKVINIGNNYNAAKSLAIKDACKKFGIALYIEDGSDEEAGTEGFVAPIPEVKPATSNLSIPVVHGADGTHKADGSITAGGNVEETKFTPPPFPGESAVSLPKGISPLTQVSKNDSVTAGVSVSQEKPVDSPGITQEASIEKITDVQKVAVQGLLQLKGFNYKELLISSLGRTDNLPDSPEGLTYQEAVTVIKYGNDVDKR